MQPNCADMLETAGDLLSFGVLPEASRELVRLQACSRRAGCEHWHHCLKSVEGRWQAQVDAWPAAVSQRLPRRPSSS